MVTREELHEELCWLLGSRNVYYQPPESIKLTYPCFVYKRNSGEAKRANNGLYRFDRRYQLTLIDKDPDSTMPVKVLTHFPMCRYEQDFVSDNLYHHVFALYPQFNDRGVTEAQLEFQLSNESLNRKQIQCRAILKNK